MIHVLWDASDIWGPLALWGLRGLGVPFTVLRGSDVVEGALERERAKLLLVPGGFSRHKDAALGEKGRNAVRDFVGRGGAYLGFCGGAGLALTGEHALGLCPWQRAGYENRFQHHMSGHFYMTVDDGIFSEAKCSVMAEGRQVNPVHGSWLRQHMSPSPLLPVWWPGRFAPKDDTVVILARYAEPGSDFWLADLPVAELPPSAFEDWDEKYGFSPSPSFLSGEPCVIEGRYEEGRYVLSYTHLETPESPDANAWLACMLGSLAGDRATRSLIPQWDLEHLVPVWNDAGLLSLWIELAAVLDAGKAAGLFFVRSSWLMGWRTGLPGAVCNTLRARLHAILSLPPCPEARSHWEKVQAAFVPAFRDFARRATSYLLAERLAMTLSKDLPDALSPEKLLTERTAIFGASGMAAHAGGMLGDILPIFDELAFLQLRGSGNS